MQYVDIDSAFDTYYEAGAFGLTTAKEGLELTDHTLPYASVYMLPGGEDVLTNGTSGYDESAGVYQVDLYYPIGAGKGDILTKGDEIKTHFFTGKRLTNGDTEIQIQNTDRFPIVNEDDKLRLTLSINWLAQVQR